MRGRPIITGLLVVAAMLVAGCGGADMSEGPSESSAAVSPVSSDAPGVDAAMVVTRSGGIAGFHDVLEIAPDGTALMTSKSGMTSSCTPSATALARLRAIDLAAVGSGPPKQPIADGFTYSVTVGGVIATAGDGDQGLRAEFAAAAAEIVSSCLASGTGSSLPLE